MSLEGIEQRVVSAYKRTGLTPTVGSIYIRNGGCCGLGALLAAAGTPPVPGEIETPYSEAAKLLGTESVGAFALGFDEGLTGMLPRTNSSDSTKYAAGYRSGQAVIAAGLYPQPAPPKPVDASFTVPTEA